jgi:Asp-tRNA(Asn)/Glu-tRNA(Gln) amidotransferase A subunit family amidase
MTKGGLDRDFQCNLNWANMMSTLTRLSATEMAQMVRAKTVSPAELVQAHLDSIRRFNPQINAFVTVDGDRALSAARLAEEVVLRGANLAPLHGVPVTIKSSIDVAGLRCETGSRLRAGNIPTADAPLVTRLKKAGAIVLGNTNVPEFLMAYETDNLLYGRSNNPWDLKRTPGGSSGGECAAIAACCSAGGVGSDGGGSIRVPAHYSGICGLKPTPGRVPATGHFPASAGPFAQLGVVGPLARTVGDVQLLFEAMAGPDIGDPGAAPVPVRQPHEQEVRALRVGYFEDDGHHPVTAETRATVRAAAAKLKGEGFNVSPFRFDEFEQARDLWWQLFGLAGGFVLRPLIKGHESEISPILREFIGIVHSDPPLTLESFMNTLLGRDHLRPLFLAQMKQFPILLCPVCSVPAFRHGERKWIIEGRSVEYLNAMSYTQWFNVLGNPVAVLPVGRSPEGLPIGVQVVGRPFCEEQVLAVAAEIERGRAWQAPPLIS